MYEPFQEERQSQIQVNFFVDILANLVTIEANHQCGNSISGDHKRYFRFEDKVMEVFFSDSVGLDRVVAKNRMKNGSV